MTADDDTGNDRWAHLLDEAIAAGEAGNGQEALRLYAALVGETEGMPALEARALCALAKHNQASELARLGQTDEALAAYDHVHRAFGADPAPEVRGWAANAQLLAGVLLDANGDPGSAVHRWYRLIEQYREDPAAEIRQHVASAMWLRARSEPEPQRRVELYEEVVAAYQHDALDKVQVTVAKAYYDSVNLVMRRARVGGRAMVVRALNAMSAMLRTASNMVGG